MIEVGLLAALSFALVAVIASYLLKTEIQKLGTPESTIEKAALIAIGMPPIKSASSRLVVQKSPEELSLVGKAWLFVFRVALAFSVLSVGVVVVFGLQLNA